jgi:hypothetical protein
MKIPYLILLASVMLLVSACTVSNDYGPYEGKVVDAETGEPLEGAAVTVVFYFNRISPAGAKARLIGTREALTDKNGAFSIPRTKIKAFRLLAGWDHYGYAWIFKPGYGCYPNHKDVKPLFVPAWTIPAGKHTVFELPKLKTREERIRNAGCYPVSIHYSRGQFKELFRLVEEERRLLGL